MKNNFVLALLLIVLLGACDSTDSPVESGGSTRDLNVSVVWRETTPPPNSHFIRCWVWFYTDSEGLSAATGYSGTVCE